MDFIGEIINEGISEWLNKWKFIIVKCIIRDKVFLWFYDINVLNWINVYFNGVFYFNIRYFKVLICLLSLKLLERFILYGEDFIRGVIGLG